MGDRNSKSSTACATLASPCTGARCRRLRRRLLQGQRRHRELVLVEMYPFTCRTSSPKAVGFRSRQSTASRLCIPMWCEAPLQLPQLAKTTNKLRAKRSADLLLQLLPELQTPAAAQ